MFSPPKLTGRDFYFIAEQSAPAPHLAHPEGCAALRIVLVTVQRVSRSCEHFPDGFGLHLVQSTGRCVSAPPPHPSRTKDDWLVRAGPFSVGTLSGPNILSLQEL